MRLAGKHRVAVSYFVVMVAGIVTVLAAQPAGAGEYVMTSQTGGTSTMVPGPPFSPPYGPGTDGYGASPATGGASPSVSCSGTITTTFEWVPSYVGEEPPDQVVVTEWCRASWYGYGSVLPNGSCTNALGFDEVLTQGSGPYPGLSWKRGISQGTRYSVTSGTPTITITANPSMSASSTAYIQGEVRYTVQVSQVRVSINPFHGYATDPSVLIGIGVTASLIAPLYPSSYSWTVTGGDPFKDWYFTPAYYVPESSTYVGVGSETGSTCHFYYAKATFDEESTITCSAHLNVPSGSLPAGGLDVTVHLDVGLEKPLNSVGVYMGTVQVHERPYPGGLSLILWGAEHEGFTWGTIWVGTVETPPFWVDWGPEPGGWNFTQLITPSRTWGPPPGGHSFNGQRGLDNTFGYNPYWPDLFPDDGSEHRAEDAPNNLLVPGMTYSTMNDSFTTYTMYRPSGSDTKFVALKSWDWYAAGRADWNGSQWVSSSTSSGWQFTEDFPRQPLWTICIANE